MLINCPRCGFQQPIDKYCAQCGVDIETYRPAPPPFWKRVTGNLFVQLSLLVLLAGVAGIMVYEKGQENIEQRVSYLKSSVQINPSSMSTASAETFDENPPPPPPPDSALTDQASQAPTENAAADGNPNAAVSAVNPTISPAGARALAKTNAHLIVSYAEVDANTLSSITAASRRTGQYMSFNDYSAGILPNISKTLMARQIKVLHTEDRPLQVGTKSYQWFLGTMDPRDPSRQIGLNTYFELSDMDPRNLRGSIEILRTWREQPSPGVFEIQKRPFPAIFEIGGNIGFFMAGVMPRDSHLSNEEPLLNVDVFKILKSPAFRAGETEFVIFVEYEKGN